MTCFLLSYIFCGSFVDKSERGPEGERTADCLKLGANHCRTTDLGTHGSRPARLMAGGLVSDMLTSLSPALIDLRAFGVVWETSGGLKWKRWNGIQEDCNTLSAYHHGASKPRGRRRGGTGCCISSWRANRTQRSYEITAYCYEITAELGLSRFALLFSSTGRVLHGLPQTLRVRDEGSVRLAVAPRSCFDWLFHCALSRL